MRKKAIKSKRVLYVTGRDGVGKKASKECETDTYIYIHSFM